jgi:uncharacterized protein with HEPN domain
MLSKDQHCLDSILESIEKIRIYTKGFNNPDQFNSDHQAFDAVMMNFVIIGEMVSKLSENLKNQHLEVEWIKIKGFRNIVAHDYFGIDAEEIWQIINNDLPDLRKKVIKILDN